MKIIFVDAENVGFKGLESIKASILDKVFVFSKALSIQAYAEKKLFLCLSDYPEGANQADFYIIAYLSRLLISLTDEERSLIQFLIYSNDVALINAFKFQCELCGAKNGVVTFHEEHKISPLHITKSIVNNQLPPQKLKTTNNLALIETQIFNLLKKPKGLVEIEKSLKLSKPIFTQAVNELIKKKKIHRISKNGKKWLQSK